MARMKKRDNTLSLLILLMFIILTVGAIVTNYTEKPAQKSDPFANVRKYRPLIQKTLATYHLKKYTPVVLALMEQESKGRGNDPMQSSESAGLAPNAIQSPKRSIRQGINHFRHVLTYGNQKKVDFSTIIQAYNMGAGYIDYVAKHGGKNSEKLAKQFSLMQVHKKPKLYDCGGNRNNFRYPYCYGDFTYSGKVLNYLQSLKATAPVDHKVKTTAE